MKRILRTSIAILLVFSVLINIPSTLVYANVFENGNDAISSQVDSWNTSPELITNNNMNILPKSATCSIAVAREPDIGNALSDSNSILDWFSGLFHTNTFTHSKGSGSKSTVYKNITKEGIKISSGSKRVNLIPLEGNFDISTATDCAVRYTNVFDGVDYQFSSVDGNGKIEILYEGISNNNDFHFKFTHSDNLSIENIDRKVVFSEDQSPVFEISAPVAKDIGGSTGDAAISVLENGTFVVKVDNEWLQDISRAYPVSISIDITKYDDILPIALKSAPVYSGAGVAGGEVEIDITPGGFDIVTGIASVGSASLVDLDSSIIAEIVAGEYTGTDTSIPLSSIGNNTIVDVFVTTNTGELLQGKDKLIVVTIGSNINKFSVLKMCQNLGADPQYALTDNNVSAYAETLSAGSSFVFRNPTGTDPGNFGISSEDEINDLLEWLFGAGIDVCEYGLEPINYNTGNFVYSATDAVLAEYPGEFVIGRTYNSTGAKVKGALGRGWSFAYDISLARRTGGPIDVTFGDGRGVWFRWNGSCFAADEDKNYTMGLVNGGYEVVDDANKTVYFFNYSGDLVTKTESNGNITSFTYDGSNNLSSITTSAGQTIYVSCDPSTDCITSITLPDSGVIRYTYDGECNLAAVTDQAGRTTRYTYDAGHRLLTVTDPEEVVTVNNTYDGQNRVVKQLDANGNVSTLVYENGKTTVTDNKGNVTQVFYDSQYRTTKVINPDGSVELKTWDNASNMTSYTGTDGITTYYEYNGDGLVTKEARADGAYTTYSYDSANNLSKYRDFAGNTTQYSHDSKNNLVSITYADGSSVSYTYNSHNQLMSVTDQLGNTAQFEYTGAVCTAYTDAIGNRTEYGYSIMGWLTAVKDASGNITRYLYNACGERYAEQRPDGSLYTYIYDDAGYVTAIVDELGYTSTFSYDNQGNMLVGMDPLGNTINMTYDANNNKLTSVDALGQTTSYAYDNMDRVTAVTNPNGGVTAYVYDAAGNIIAITDPNGNTASLTYNNILGVTTSVTEPGDRTTAFEYDVVGNLTKVTYPDGSTQTFVYDNMYRLTENVSQLGLVTKYTYDAAGNVTSISNSENQCFIYAYDANGNVLSVTDALGSTTSYTYDSLGRVSSMTDAGGLVSSISYDIMSRPITDTDEAGNTTSYEYDLRGNVMAITDAKGNRSEFYYNELGNLVAVKDALGNITTYEYDAVEQLAVTIDALTNRTQLDYDANGNLTRLTEANGAETKLSYDKNGNNTKIVDAEGYITTINYDFADQIVQTISPTGLEKNFTYDSMCRIIKATDSTGGFVQYTYDAEGNVLSETDAAGRVASYTYDTLGRLISETGFDGETYTYTYDALNRVTSSTDPEGKVTSYEYDYRNNLVKVTEFDGSEYYYEYDALSRLLKSTNPIGATITYTYDVLGNLIRSTDAEGNITAVDYDALNRITAVTGANDGVTSYTYDAVGNVISSVSPLGNISQYQYDSVYNLIAYKDTENYVTTYAYDLVGNMTSTTSARNAVTQYEYDGAGNVVKMTDAMGYVTVYDYMPDGVLTMLTQANGGKYSYEYDILDRVTKITDPEGYFRAFTYDSNGDVVAETDSLEINNTYAYDIMHRMTAASEENITTTYSYDARGNLASIVMPNNGTYSYAYDVIDRLSAMTDPLGLDVTYSYNLNNQLLSETKENVAVTRYAYDSMGNNISVTDPMGEITKFVYDIENNLTTSTDPLGNSVSAVYDALGRRITLTDELGEKFNIVYDPHNNIIGTADAKGLITSYTFDLVDNLTSVTDANGVTASYTYDSMGNLVSATNGNGNTSAYTYNLRGDLTSVTNPMGQVEQYKYDIAGKLTEYVKPSGIAISYDYDKLNNLIKKTADDETPVAYAYDNMGLRIEMNDDIGEVFYEYDAFGNATKVVHHNGDTVRYTYDVFGRLSEIMYPDGYCTDYEYDLCDRLVKVIGRDSGITTYTYDANGNVTRCDRSNGSYTTYTYNARNELILLENRRANKKDALLSSYTYEYDKNGYITKETEKVDSSTYVRTYTYDAVGQLVGYNETLNGNQNAKHEYSYDAAGNRTGMVYYDASNTKYWTDYVYDANNELVTETYNYNKNKNKVISTITAYSYDIDGNLVNKTVDDDEVWQYLWTAESRLEAVTKGGALLMAATYDGENNRIFQISDAASESKVHEDNQLKKEWKSENGNSYPWENGNGNGGNGTGHSNTGNGQTNNGGKHNHTGNNSDGLKHANCKQCVDEQEAFVQSLADDAVTIDGVDYLPVGKTNSYKDYELIYYINDVTIPNEEVLVEYGANGTATGTYEYGLQRLSVEYVNEAKEYYLYNGTGNVTQTTAQNGSMFLRYTYDPFGNVTSINAPITVDIDDLNRYTYNGEDYDYNTGLQYLRARYYSPNTGNFISQDTFLGGALSNISLNRYTYTGNSPVMFSDPSGHWGWNDLKNGAVNLWNSTTETLTSAYNDAKDVYNSAKNYVEKKIDEAGDALCNAGCIAKIFKNHAVNSIKDTVNTVTDMYKNNKQDFWVLVGSSALVVGAVALSAICPAAAPFTGAVIGAGMDVCGQLLSGKSTNEIDWGQVAVSGATGLVTGLVGGGASYLSKAMLKSEISLLTTKAVSATISAGAGALTGAGAELYQQYAMQRKCAADGIDYDINWKQIGVRAAGGAVSGAITGLGITNNASCYGSKGFDLALDIIDVGVNFTESTAYGIAGGANLNQALLDGSTDALNGIMTDMAFKSIGALAGKTCFVAGTQVLTATGLVAIEDIKAGDTVIATNPETGETDEKEVVETYVRETNELVHIWVNGEEIITTNTHPFYVPEKGWVDAVDLRAGDMLVLVNGEYVVIEKIQHEITEEPVTVYNFQVADFHTYYVGEQSVLVHNANRYNESNNTPDLYHYTNEEGANAIAKSGVIIPDKLGRVFVTTDEISSQDVNNALFMGTRDDSCGTFRVEITLNDKNDPNLSSYGATQPNELIYYGAIRNGRNASIEVKPNE